MNNKSIITIIGGGHGMSNLLKGLRKFKNLRIITAVTDSGGSTGVLRTTFNCPAMGDIRLVLSTLGNDKIKDIFEYRIPKYKDCVGNLIISSLIKLYSFNEAIKIIHDLLGIPEEQQIIPSSLDNAQLCGEYDDGFTVNKESDFTHTGKITNLWMNPELRVNPEAIKSIKESDYVIISPGSFFTSILASIILPGMAKEINKKTVIYIANILQQQGETIGLDLEGHFNWLNKYIKIDYLIVNNGTPTEKIMQSEYESYLMPVTLSTAFKDILGKKNIKCIEGDLIDNNKKETILHDYNKLYTIIKNI
jgi:uncharacterized cofD-like protein